MTTIHLVELDVALQLAARRVLEGAGLAVTEAANDDDSAAVDLAVRRVLERAGFVVVETSAEIPATAPPDLVIADLTATSLATIRRRYPATRVLAILSEETTATGATGSLAKPFTPSQLLAAVRLCLAQRAATTGRRSRSPRPRRPRA
jgi:DNA-binding response OmpR family regulator